MIRPIICFRPLRWFGRRDWWFKRRSGIYGFIGSRDEKYHLLDLGAITIGWESYKR